MARRSKIPTGRADAFLFDSDMSCCICQKRKKSLQLHHIDGDNANHASDNIAVLCHDHHSQATATPGLGRGLSPGIVKRYRDDWLATVLVRRECAKARSLVSGSESMQASNTGLPQWLTDRHMLHELLISAVACNDVRKVRDRLTTADWVDQAQILQELHPFIEFDAGYEVRREVLYTLSLLVDRTRQGMPASLAHQIEHLILPSLPIMSLVVRYRQPISSETDELLRSAVEIGFGLAYDGVKYLTNIGVVAAGARILFIVLRFAHLNDLVELKRHVLDEFARVESDAVAKEFDDAKRWLEFERLDALAVGSDPLPAMPKDVYQKVINAG